jgi:predicted nucleic acid-binding protein
VTLADTSVWVAHFRHSEPRLADYLAQGVIVMHPWVRGELACGRLKDRESILSDLQALPAAQVAADSEVLTLLERHVLWGRGLGWIDVHLLTSALLSGCRLWTLDKSLNNAARELGVA